MTNDIMVVPLPVGVPSTSLVLKRKIRACARGSDRFKIEVSPGTPLDDLRLQIDRNGDGIYEQSWMSDASVLGEAAADRTSPVTQATLEDDPQREGPLLALNARDRGSPDEGIPPSGVGITY